MSVSIPNIVAPLAIAFALTSSCILCEFAHADDDWQSAFQAKTFTADAGSLNYRLLEPATDTPDANKQPMPLVVFLHGAGERGEDNQAQLKHGVSEFYKRRDKFPCYMVVPQCPTGKRWVERNWSEPTGSGTFVDSPSDSMKLVLGVVDQMIQSGNIDPKRVYITGLSMGGYGTWFAAGFEGTPFVAAAPICGGGDPSWASRYKEMPIWAFHGDADTAVPVARSREMIDAIQKAGGTPKYTEYPGVGHDSWTQSYANDAFYEWLFSQSKK